MHSGRVVAIGGLTSEEQSARDGQRQVDIICTHTDTNTGKRQRRRRGMGWGELRRWTEGTAWLVRCWCGLFQCQR